MGPPRMRMKDKYGKRTLESETFFFGVCSESMYAYDSYPSLALAKPFLTTDGCIRALVVPRRAPGDDALGRF